MRCITYGRHENKILVGKPEGFTGELGVVGIIIFK
jgi:hypothetical protein